MLQLFLETHRLFQIAIPSLLIITTCADCAGAAVEEEHKRETKLCLEINTLGTSVSEGAPIEVEVRLRNCGRSYVVIPPRIFPRSTGKEPDPWGVLTFLIQREEGPPAQYSGEWLGNKLKLPSTKDFLILGPDYFYGMKIALNENPFRYEITRPGQYRIVAIFQTSAKEWLEERSIEEPQFSLSHVFTGTVRSKPTTIMVQ